LLFLLLDPSKITSAREAFWEIKRGWKNGKDENAYIRPSSQEKLQAALPKTREVIIICEAAGFDTIIIETVMRKRNSSSHSMTLALKFPGAGDESWNQRHYGKG
jgi:LAO/AO transport system kinase